MNPINKKVDHTPANIDLSEINELDSIDIGIPTPAKDAFNSISEHRRHF